MLWHATSVLSTPCIRFSSRPQATVGGPPSQHDDSFDAGAADDAAAGDDDDDDDDDQQFVGFQLHAGQLTTVAGLQRSSCKRS